MSLSMILAVVALGCSVFLASRLAARLWPVVAVLASGAELLMALGVLRLSISGVSLSLVLGVTLAVAGGLCWLKVSAKLQVTAATVVALVGVLQAVTGVLPR